MTNQSSTVEVSENQRQCATCAAPVSDGFYCSNRYYCSKKCLNESFQATGETWNEHFTPDGDCYWTSWDGRVAP